MGGKPNFLPRQTTTQNWLMARNMFEKIVTNRLESLTKIQLHLVKWEFWGCSKAELSTPVSNTKMLKRKKNWEMDSTNVSNNSWLWKQQSYHLIILNFDLNLEFYAWWHLNLLWGENLFMAEGTKRSFRENFVRFSSFETTSFTYIRNIRRRFWTSYRYRIG